jgi:hypothetical protein
MDEKFSQLQQMLQGQTQLSAAVPLSGAPAPTGTGGPPAPTGTGGAPAALPAATPPAAAASSDIGRQLADAQFNATLQGFNRSSQGLPPASGAGGSAAPKKDEDEPGFFGKVSRALFGSKKNDATKKDLAPAANATLRNVRDAIARFAAANSGVPEINQIYDWKSLRRVVNQYGRTSLPATEEEAGFSFVDYKPAPSREAYLLVVDLREPQDGVKRVEIEDNTALRSMPR